VAFTPAPIGGAIVAMLVVAEKKVVARLRAANATVSGRAIALDNLRAVQRIRLQRLAHSGAVQQTPDGRWYLVEPIYEGIRARRRRMAVVTILAAILAGLVVFVLPYFLNVFT
jgi:hypothetical protein